MKDKITNKKEYILVEPEANEYWEILEALGVLFRMAEYRHKNTIWVMPDVPIEGGYDDLYKLREFVSKYYPKGNKQDNKTAIVVQSGILEGLAESWATIVRELPFEVGVFNDMQSAEEWILAN